LRKQNLGIVTCSERMGISPQVVTLKLRELGLISFDTRSTLITTPDGKIWESNRCYRFYTEKSTGERLWYYEWRNRYGKVSEVRAALNKTII
jgi:hypothetical protein